jgi:hypothetical protein
MEISMSATQQQPFASHRSPDSANARAVFINGLRLPAEQLRVIEGRYRIRIPDGRYWYDRLCGAWGLEGGPQLGIGIAGLDLGGPLRADASNGPTGVFVNGRELHAFDVQRLQMLAGMVIPGRWAVDAHGNFGPEGWPKIGNLFALAQLKGGGGPAGPGEVVSKYGWFASDGTSSFFQGSIGSGVTASNG